jgi:hypothetical protein
MGIPLERIETPFSAPFAPPYGIEEGSHFNILTEGDNEIVLENGSGYILLEKAA